ncbi:hypothetical protein BDZ89DRAFT_457079 [Hymenopellis radicata]|nr:hypothetical protein BDZ89DRAFT_457079 [Hymenopellis radicata]
MWTIAGPFDNPAKDELNFTKQKVLKPGKSYTLGRKAQPLTINSKLISREHCVIIVGDYPLDNASDPTFIPTLQVVTKQTKKQLKVYRGDDQIPVVTDASVVLQHNDKLAVASDIPIYAIWQPVCCFVNSPKLSLPLESLASLAISLVYTHNPHVTHHITQHCDATPAIAASLLSACSIVTPEWLNEVVRVGALPGDDKDSLEFNFHLPSSKKYYPKCAKSLDKKFQKDTIWLPNESRLDLFKSFRFLCVGDQSRDVDSDLRVMIERGGGAIETFNVQDGVLKWKKALSRGVAKEGARVLAIADPEAMTSAVGKATWDKFIGEATDFHVGFSTFKELIEAVLMADVTSLRNKSSGGLDASQSSTAPREEESMETPVEPAPPPPARRKLPRRAASRQPSQEVDIAMADPESINAVGPSTSEPSVSAPEPQPVTLDSVEEAVPVRRKLKRRVITQEDKEELGIMESTQPETERRPLTRRAQGGFPVITGIDDNSVLLDVSPDSTGLPPETETPASTSSSLPPPRSTRRPLKRRRETVEETLDSQFASLAPKEEPSYKKHKALFDSLDPDNAGISFDGTAFSQTQFGSDTPGGAGFLRTVHEEEEETQTQSTGPTQSRGQKRKASETEDAEMAEVGQALQPRSVTPSSGELPPSKKRAVENVNAVERLPTTVVQDGHMRPPPSTVKASKSAKPGADPGKPDTDAAFLKAIASTKRGKKNEDEFDREFNKLKISKPNLEKDAVHEQWKVLDDFGDDANIRGNFMVVVPLDVYKKDARAKSRGEPNREWDGLPNFKKFKKSWTGHGVLWSTWSLAIPRHCSLQTNNSRPRTPRTLLMTTRPRSLPSPSPRRKPNP